MDSNVTISINRRLRACLIDTREFIAVSSVKDVDRRCQYVSNLIHDLGYPLVTLPWDPLVNDELVPQIEQLDLENLFIQLKEGFKDLGYNGEEIILSPSKQSWVIVHFIKGQC